MNVHVVGNIEHMAKARAKGLLTVITGGDDYLTSQKLRDLTAEFLVTNPDAEVIDLSTHAVDGVDAADGYALDEAVSPSLFSTTSLVVITDLQDAEPSLIEALLGFLAHPPLDHQTSIIAVHNGSAKGRQHITALEKAGATALSLPKLKSDKDKLSFVTAQFSKLNRTIRRDAAEQLVAVLGNKTGELAAMCEQLCFDFDENPMSLQTVMHYLDATPEVTGFSVADVALEGHTAQAITKLRYALKNGMEPVMLIGALAAKLRTLGKVSAMQAGRYNPADLHLPGWLRAKAETQLRGWSSEGLGLCVEALSHADFEAKSTSGDPVYALEKAVELISRKGSLLPGMDAGR